jgi:hypothetical protein
MERISTTVIQPYEYFPCSLEIFTINGIKACIEDFGETVVAGSCMENNCSCEFQAGESTKEVLDKYKITQEEFYNICEELESKLYVFSCGLCS